MYTFSLFIIYLRSVYEFEYSLYIENTFFILSWMYAVCIRLRELPLFSIVTCVWLCVYLFQLILVYSSFLEFLITPLVVQWCIPWNHYFRVDRFTIHKVLPNFYRLNWGKRVGFSLLTYCPTDSIYLLWFRTSFFSNYFNYLLFGFEGCSRFFQ